MSDIHEEETNSISQSNSSEADELENGYESNDTDSLNLDDEEEEDDGGSFPMHCLSDRLVGGSLVLHIDQTGMPMSAPGSFGREVNPSTSTATSLSDTASDSVSTRAVMGDTPSTIETNNFPPGDDDAGDNSSQISMADSEAERVRRIHNSIFNSLEHDLAELVRIREETIQFLETGARPGDNGPGSMSEVGSGDRNRGEGGNENQPFGVGERLSYYTRPVTITTGVTPQEDNTTEGPSTSEQGATSANRGTLQKRWYTPVAKFDNAPSAKPAKPYVDAGLASCDEKAAAARKILDKLQYGDPEDESACFVRRFWRETSTVVDHSSTGPLSLDVAALAQRTASLQASLEEAFDGLRLRLQEVQRTPFLQDTGEESNRDGTESNEGGGESQRENQANTGTSTNNDDDESQYQNWDQETSILNNPLNYDIWDELEEGGEAGPTITARINMAERRALATTRTRQVRQCPAASSFQGPVTTSTVAVGPDNSDGNRMEGAELDDDSTDDEEMMSYFRVRCNDISNGNANDRPSNMPRNLNDESRAFFQDIGISEEMGQDLFNMFTFADDEVQVPQNLQMGNDNVGMSSAEVPEPLFPRDRSAPSTPQPDIRNDENSLSLNDSNENRTMINNDVGNETSESCSSPPPPQISLLDNETRAFYIAPNREDECSTRVYLDDNYLNFPMRQPNSNQTEEEHEDDNHNQQD